MTMAAMTAHQGGSMTGHLFTVMSDSGIFTNNKVTGKTQAIRMATEWAIDCGGLHWVTDVTAVCCNGDIIVLFPAR